MSEDDGSGIYPGHKLGGTFTPFKDGQFQEGQSIDSGWMPSHEDILRSEYLTSLERIIQHVRELCSEIASRNVGGANVMGGPQKKRWTPEMRSAHDVGLLYRLICGEVAGSLGPAIEKAVADGHEHTINSLAKLLWMAGRLYERMEVREHEEPAKAGRGPIEAGRREKARHKKSREYRLQKLSEYIANGRTISEACRKLSDDLQAEYDQRLREYRSSNQAFNPDDLKNLMRDEGRPLSSHGALQKLWQRRESK